MQYGVTDKGFILKTFNDIMSSIESNFKKKVGDEWALDQYTPEGAIFYIVGDEIAKNWLGCKAAYDADFLDLCTGIQLDYKGKEEDLPRSQGRFSNTMIEFTASKELTVPTGVLVRRKGSELYFRTTEQLVIGSTLKGVVPAIATQTGEEYNTSIGSINELVTSVNDVTSITNTTLATGGEGLESDDKYRERIRAAKKSRGGSTVDSITTELNKLPIVSDTLVLENVGDSTDTNGVEPGKIKIFIDGTSDITIAQTIHKFKADGIDTMGNKEFEVENIGGQKITERFNLFTKKQLYITVNVTSISGTLTDELKATIKQNLIDYVDNIQTGPFEDRINEIVINQLSTQVYNSSDKIKKITTKAGLSSSPTGEVDIPIPIGERFYCDTSTIEVS